MQALNDRDRELIEAARAAIAANYDEVRELHTVGAAVRCGDGTIFDGVNIYDVHSACAEQVAVGSAITRGQREFVTIVAVRGKAGEEIIPPCGNCRQWLSAIAPDCEVILTENGKVTVRELLPYAYEIPEI